MTNLETRALDPWDYAFQEDPYPLYARLRSEEPLHHNAEHDFWVLTRHADVLAALQDHTTYSSAMGVSLDRSAWGPHAHTVMSFLAMDPPRHQRLRSLVSRAFTPRRVRELEEHIGELTADYYDRVLEDRLDWITDFSGRLPMDVICELMGVPAQDRDELRRLADLVVHREQGLQDVPPDGMAASLELVGYYADLVEHRKRRPGDDLTSALLAAELDGDRLADQEVIAFLFLMVVAGNETTTKLLGNALFHLGAHPDQQAAVWADPSLVPRWIEETLRFDTSSQLLARHLREPVELHGALAPAGAKMLLALGSANRDERVFTDPAAYDVHRDPQEVARMVSFGGGRHFCLGAHLARLEARVALSLLVDRVSALEVDRPGARRVHSANVRGFASLPIRVERR